MKINNTGFTLIELLVVLAIAAILLLIAVPSYQGWVEKSNVEAAQESLARDVAFARQEAIARNTTVAICRSADGATCVGTGEWQQGWIVYLDNNAAGTSGAVDADEDILRVHQALPANYTLQGSSAFVQFSARGALMLPSSGTPTFEVCSPSNDNQRGMLMLRSGRGITSRRDVSSGTYYIQKDSDGNPVAISCA